MATNKVKLSRGSKANYANIESKDSNELYITTDEQWMYLGDKKLCQFNEGNNISITEDNIISATVPEYESTVIDVSEMFDISTDADVSAFLFKRDNSINKGLIKLHGFDNSELDEDLTIVPTLGFGPQYDSYQTVRQTLDGVTFADYTVKINKEMVNESGSIEVPYGIQTFDVNYYLHDGTNVKPSYYITTDSIMHPFELENTPINNFLSSAAVPSAPLTINGISVAKNTIQSIQFGTSYNGVTSIGDYFLGYCSGSISIDLSGLNNVTSLGSAFLYNCSGLTSIDLSPLSRLTPLGSAFLSGCSGLTSIDLSPLSNLISTGNNFLSGCSGLTSIDLSPLSRLTSLGSAFLSGCSGLTSIDLSPLSNLISTGNNFLSGCSGLTSIDLSPLSRLTSLGSAFLSGCSGLTSIDLSPLNNVTSLNDAFLSGCSGLTSIDLSPLTKLKSINNSFLNNCTALASIDLSPLNNVPSLSIYFLSNCTGLTSIQIGDVDWGNKTVATLYLLTNVPNVSTSTLYADTQELADIFKSKMDGKISDWSVEINT